jgi:hypothetical protein
LESETETEADFEDTMPDIGALQDTTEPEEPPVENVEEPVPETTAPSDEIDTREYAEELEEEEEMPQKDAELASAMGIPLDPSRDMSLDTTREDEAVMPAAPEPAAAQEATGAAVGDEQIEAAIERLIEAKLAEKIDALLNRSIEKAVSSEISRLKRLLTDSLSDD